LWQRGSGVGGFPWQWIGTRESRGEGSGVGEQVRGEEGCYIGGGGEETLGAMSRGVEHVRRLHSPLTANGSFTVLRVCPYERLILISD